MTHDDKIKEFARVVECQQQEHLVDMDYMPSACDNRSYKTKIIPGRVYTKVDVGGSGKFMVDQEGNIYGIKGYGKVHKGHCYGTLDTINSFNWGPFYPIKKKSEKVENKKLTEEDFDDYLDDLYGQITIAGFDHFTSYVLKTIDPTGYGVRFVAWLAQQN